MSLSGIFHIACEYGALIVKAAAGREAEFWLRNDRGLLKLCLGGKPCRRQLLLPFDQNIKLAHLEKLLQSTSKEAIQAVGEFGYGQKDILQFCLNGGQPAFELVRDCPALAYLIANKILPRISPEIRSEVTRDILAQKRTAALARINWPAEKWIARLLRKIPPSQCSAEMFDDILLILLSEDSARIKVLRHLHVLYSFVVELLADKDFSPLLAYSFYEDMSTLPTEPELSPGFEVFELRRMILRSIAKGLRVPPLKSVADLASLHERLIQWLTAKVNYEEIKEIVFQPPPLPGKVFKNETEEFGVFPLENGKALWREGVAMKHCLAGYAEQILYSKGAMYAYHVRLPNAPEATLMIRSFGFGWHIKELRGKHNLEPPVHVVRWVKSWLAGQASSSSAEPWSGRRERLPATPAVGQSSLGIIRPQTGAAANPQHVLDNLYGCFMQDELLDLVDKNDTVIGKKMRAEIYAEGLSNFRVVNLFLVNTKGEIWIPRRTAHKRIFPLCLDMSMGGHVQSGESYEMALQRELQEELNLDPGTTACKLLGHLTPATDGVSAFMKVYEIRSDKTPDYNRDDFVEFFWLTPRAFWERIAGGEFAKDDLPKLVRLFYGEAHFS